MKKLSKSRKPFLFYSRLHLRELTGLKAATLPQLLHHLKTAPGSVIYYHTHHHLGQHETLVPGEPNDFAYWITEVLGEGRLGEQLSAIDTIMAPSIGVLRERICEVIDGALKEMPALGVKMAPSGEEFYFMKAMNFVFRTDHSSKNLEEFADCLERVTLPSIYYHTFESRLRFDRPTNDFSEWLAHGLGEEELSGKFAKLSPYDCSLEVMRGKMVELIRNRIAEL